MLSHKIRCFTSVKLRKIYDFFSSWASVCPPDESVIMNPWLWYSVHICLVNLPDVWEWDEGFHLCWYPFQPLLEGCPRFPKKLPESWYQQLTIDHWVDSLTNGRLLLFQVRWNSLGMATGYKYSSIIITYTVYWGVKHISQSAANKMTTTKKQLIVVCTIRLGGQLLYLSRIR